MSEKIGICFGEQLVHIQLLLTVNAAAPEHYTETNMELMTEIPHQQESFRIC